MDLARDDKLWMLRNRPRDRRVLFLVLLVAGCMMGGFLRREVGSPGAIVVSVGIKAAVHFGVLFARVDGGGEDEGSSADGGEVPI